MQACRRMLATASATRVVVALGGNALLRDGEPVTGAAQLANVRVAAIALARVSASARDLIVTHGNGPQSGYLLRTQSGAFDLDVIDAETQGMIGYPLAEELRNELPKSRPVAALLTQVEVDLHDAAFALPPTKPIGPFYERDESASVGGAQNTMIRLADGRYRRVVHSPRPMRVLELDAVRALLEVGTIVICGGGGGIPVARDADGRLHGVAAVIDKDRTAALLAASLGADALLIATDVEGLYTDFDVPEKRKLMRHIDVATLSDADEAALLASLPAGSMRPKLEAALQFARSGGWAAIGSLAQLPAMMAGTSGTRITGSAARN